MQEVFEKIINKLNERIEYHEKRRKVLMDAGLHVEADKITDRILELDFAKRAVEQEATEYNNGWIPCSERLPEENGYYYVTQIVKSISTGKKIAIEKAYVEFLEGKWRRAKHLEVVAWLDIEPYQPKGE